MGLAGLFAAAFVTALSGALMPGPVLFMTVRYSAAHGRWVGPLVVGGHAVIEVPLMAAVVLGLGGLLASETFVGVVGVAGGVVLLGMGGMMVRALPRLRLPTRREGDDPSTAVGPLRFILAGVASSASNPYFTIWWATVGLRFISYARPFGLAGYAVFYAGHILADLVWYSAVSESLHRGRRFLTDRGYRWLVGVLAVALVVFAAWFGWDGAGRLASPEL